MMMTWLRKHVRTQAIAVLLMVVVSGWALDWGHTGDDDPACNPVVVQHDHSAHRFKTGTHSHQAPSDHCALCHLLRLLHTALSVESPVPTEALSAQVRGQIDGTFAGALVVAHVPSRAPPAAAL